MRSNRMYFFLRLSRDILKELLIHDGHVAKDKFINAYVEVTNSYQLLRYTCVVSFYFLKKLFKIAKMVAKVDNEPRRS